VQVNLGLGQGPHAATRWRAANALGPVLAAAFSSSPTYPAQGAGGCRRLATWLRLDPSRTAPVPCRADEDPGQAWAAYALAANIMLIRSPEGCEPLTGPAMTLQTWIDEGHPRGWPTADDVAYHLTTLFPPVRPKGWLELRMIDALPDPWWRVPVAVAAVLLDDADAVAACRPVADRWREAAEFGLADEPLAAAARVCAQRTLAGLSRVGVDMTTAVLVEQWAASVRKGDDPPWLAVCVPMAAAERGAAR
jgi:glutamate--cysteine ligase